jgi:hypothetical protein
MPVVAQRESRGVVLLMLTLGIKWGWMVNATPPTLYPREYVYFFWNIARYAACLMKFKENVMCTAM